MERLRVWVEARRPRRVRLERAGGRPPVASLVPSRKPLKSGHAGPAMVRGPDRRGSDFRTTAPDEGLRWPLEPATFAFGWWAYKLSAALFIEGVVESQVLV